MMTPLEDWLTTKEAAELAGYHPDHLRVLIREGKIDARKWGDAWMVSRSFLENFLSMAKIQGEKRGPKPKRIE